MSPETKYELIEYFLHERRKGMGFGEIRKTLEERDLEPDDITFIIRKIDDRIVREEIGKSENQKARELMLIGAIATLVGIAITIGTYLAGGASFVLMYGPVVGGLGLFLPDMRSTKRCSAKA